MKEIKNIKCHLAYCGTHYFGFQKTKMGPSIEEKLEQTLVQILQHPVNLQVASRTDRGVHAQDQVINFFTEKEIDLSKLHASVRSLLPSDISPLRFEFASSTFHPTLDAKGKEYRYWICNCSTQLPFHREFSWHFHVPLDTEKMKEGAKTFVGKHNFSAFSNLRYENPIREIQAIEIFTLPDQRICISIKGDHFLYKMARNIVGTLVYVGCGKISLTHLEEILKSQDRNLAGITAPAHGLYLSRVFY